jgi:hypothetical protein
MFQSIKRNPGFFLQILLFLLGISGGIYAAIAPANSLMRWYNIDDAFYYYKVAQNVLNGHGFTFDQINPANGFHPLWMAVCLAVFWLSKYNLLLPLRVLILVSALFNGLTAVFLFRLLKKALHNWPAFIGALTWSLVPQIYSTTIVHGMETAVSALCLVTFVLNAATILISSGKKRLTWQQFAVLGLLGALTILARLDNVFVVTVVGFFLLFRVRQIPLAVFIDLVIIAFAGFMAWLIRLGFPTFELDPRSIYPLIAVGLLVKPIAYYFADVYQHVTRKNFIHVLLRLIIATAISLGIEYGVLVLLNRSGLFPTVSKSVLLIAGGLSLALVLFHHLLNPRSASEEQSSSLKVFRVWFQKNWGRVLAEGSLFALPIAILIGVYVVLNKIFFGTFTPVSGQIKTWWSTLPNTVYAHKISFLTVLGLNPEGNYGPWSLVTGQLFDFAETLTRWFRLANPRATAVIFAIAFVVLSLLVLVALNTRHGNLAKKLFCLFIPALMLGATIQVMYYTTVGYQHTRTWYWAAQMLAMVLLGSILLEGFFLWLNKPGIKKVVSTVLLTGLTIYIVVLHGLYIVDLAPQQIAAEDEDAYLAEVNQLEALTEKGSLIGMTGGGNIAYFIHDRTIVNLDGLINSAEYFNALKSGNARDFLDALPLDYVFGKPYTLQISDPYGPVLVDRLDEIGQLKGPEQFTLFHYVIKD